MGAFNGGGVGGVGPQKFDGAMQDLNANISKIISKLTLLENNVTELQGDTSTIISICNDILSGKQLSEWISDLAASGKSSATYSNSERMTALIGDNDACKNVSINQYIMDWGAENNKLGEFFKTYLNNDTQVSWSTLKTPTSVCSNSAAFTKIANDLDLFTACYNNATMRATIFNCCKTTENIIVNSTVAMSFMHTHAVYGFLKNGQVFEMNCFVTDVAPDSSSVDCGFEITYPDGSTEEKLFYRSNGTVAFNKFSKKLAQTNSWVYPYYVPWQ